MSCKFLFFGLCLSLGFTCGIAEYRNLYSDTWVATIPYAVSGHRLELAIPRAALGLTPDCNVSLDFKWADNIQKRGDVTVFFINGDSAPERRFNYRYLEN